MEKTREADSNSSLKLAVAIALLRSKMLPKPSVSSSSPSESDAQRWKRKAKERKRELLRLKEELKELEDGTQYDLFPQNASCKCYFYDNFGTLNPKRVHLGDDNDRRVNEVLHRRFLRQVRLKERRRPDVSVRPRCVLELNSEDEIEQLSTSVDFLVELCDTISPVEQTSSANLSHQAVDFILESSDSGTDGQFYVQHLIRKLGNEPYIGQRTMFMVSQRISVLADSLLFMDPFDDAFPNMHSCMFMMIQLVEFLLTDYTQAWAIDEGFESKLFEEWVRSVLQARKALDLLESRNGLYMLYMDRVIGELAKQVGQISCLKTLDPDILDNLIR